MEAKQDNSVTAAEEVEVEEQSSNPMMSRKERNKMLREKAKARVAQKRLMSNTLIHSVISQQARRRLPPALPITFSPMTQVFAPTVHLPHYAYAAPASYWVPNYGKENFLTGNTSSAPPLPAMERVSWPEPREVREDNNMVEIGNRMLRLMRMVWTTGGNPNGKRIDGIMHNHINQQGYIVCCCHGEFFTPAEFVIHAGGGPVDDPAIHIHLSH